MTQFPLSAPSSLHCSSSGLLAMPGMCQALLTQGSLSLLFSLPQMSSPRHSQFSAPQRCLPDLLSKGSPTSQVTPIPFIFLHGTHHQLTLYLFIIYVLTHMSPTRTLAPPGQRLCSPLYFQPLAQCLAHRRHSVSVC